MEYTCIGGTLAPELGSMLRYAPAPGLTGDVFPREIRLVLPGKHVAYAHGFPTTPSLEKGIPWHGGFC